MAMIKITPFQGMVPRTGKRLLPDNAATVASNLKLQSGELRPMRNPGLDYTPSSPKNGTQLSIFKARSGTSSSEWFTWPVVVDCVRVPLAADVESRFCWTGDGVPKLVTYTNGVSGGGHNYPLLANELTLGIPTPTTAVSLSASGGTGSSTTRFYRYTFVSQYGEESAPSPVSAEVTGKLDGTWNVGGTTAMQAFPLNNGVVSSTTRSGGTITAVTSAYNWLRVGDSVTVAGVATMTEANGTFTVTAVASNGLSFSYAVTAAATGTPGGAGTWTRTTAWNTSGMYRRLYRTTGSTGTWEMVSEYVSTDPLYAGWTAADKFSDTYSDLQIAGDELISEGWVPPPTDLHSLCVHPSGALLGISKNRLCMSEPLQPHAWPEAYQLASGYNGVGMAVFGTTAVMATAGMPFVATGVEPASMTGEDVQGMYPCLSKGSVCSIGNAVIYASLHGMVQVGTQGVSMFTEPWYTKDEWPSLNPDTMMTATAYGRVYVAYTGDDGAGVLVFDGPMLTSIILDVSALYADVSSGELYVSMSDGISLWDDPAEVPLQGSWRSKDFVFPAPINIGAAKIEFDQAIDPSIRTASLAQIAADTAANAVLLRPFSPQTITAVNTGTETLTVGASHGLTAGAKVQFTNSGGALPTGLSAATDYYVISAGLTTTDFRVSATSGGAAVNLTGAGSGTNKVLWMDADIGGAYADDDYSGMELSGSNLIDPPDTPASNTVTVSLFTGDTLIASKVVDSTRVFRLPGGYKKDTFSVQVTSQCTVKEIRLSETPDGLRVA